MFNISEKLKTLRANSGFTQVEIAEKLGITKPTYAGYEKDKDISVNTLAELSKIFNIPLESFFIDGIAEFQKINSKGTINRIPIISRVSAGTGVYGAEDILEWLEMPTSLCDSADYATFVKGDSMEPKIFDNDLILVRKQNYIENGKIGIFKVDNEIYCKKFFSNPITKEVVLKSLNSIYEPIYIDKNNQKQFHILGKIICKIDYNF